LLVSGNYADYEVETKISLQSGFNSFVKNDLLQWGIKPLQYRYDLIIKDKVVKSKMTFTIIDKRFF
jgi:hypothetical protein